MNFDQVRTLAQNWFTPRLEEQRLAFRSAIQRVLGEATKRGMAYSGATYGAVEKRAQTEIEQRGQTILEGYKQALASSAGAIPAAVAADVKQALDDALANEAAEVHAAIQYLRDAIKPAVSKTAAELRVRPMQKLLGDLDLFCDTLNTERGVPTFGWKPSSVRMWTFAVYEQRQLTTTEAVGRLMQRMFLQPETRIQYYYLDGTAIDTPLQSAIDAGDILVTKSEFRFFKHPQNPHDYIKIKKSEGDDDWKRDIAEHTPEFVEAILELSARKRSEMETIEKVHLEDQIREELKRQKYSFDVFLSYSERDKEEALIIHGKVTAAGGRLFMAPKEISPGEDFAAAIRNALVHSRELWLLVTPHSIKSEWVISEWGAAWALEKKIVPILYHCDVAALPHRLRGIQAVDLHRIDELITKTFPRPGHRVESREGQT
jgi:TIR domain